MQLHIQNLKNHFKVHPRRNYVTLIYEPHCTGVVHYDRPMWVGTSVGRGLYDMQVPSRCLNQLFNQKEKNATTFCVSWYYWHIKLSGAHISVPTYLGN